MVELWLVLADIGWVSLACVRDSPSIAARCLEAARIIPEFFVILTSCLELLIEWDEEAGRCAIWNGLTLTFFNVTVTTGAAKTLLLIDLVHLSDQIRLLFVA